MTQNQTLYYHEYCIGHGFQTSIDDNDGGRCSQCGDTSVCFQFSFTSKEDFVRKLLINDYLSYLLEGDEDSGFDVYEKKVSFMPYPDLSNYFEASDVSHCEHIYDVLINEPIF